ncbi:MlaD family protein [Tsukamurella ocularis]|uniref:MlaD family protein n=1 Tax=Tsukamurella ocularis TaxID=1970234 RepID=UPI002169D40D|nr:MlaD family protein [Tsukamurella ocularis]MCS3778811.1 phospholipid/cholesterol/gamma-HCH transport system substrate-binding protein [Tsukamurella ocularis]MCS3787569.1 phospholipid/cholesterol/gamma-HCH transport system substrate-binding protein [Tsukamurella ocularis]MCS3851494.1 phospholipid/cholesterol/gamma-HCH transport system substrate-binding protein [Tsukamurella ocularis]
MRKGILAVVTLVVIVVTASAYIVVDVLRLEPGKRTFDVVVQMERSSGLMETSPVTLFGLPIGKVRSIIAGPEGLSVRLAIDGAQKIPASTKVAVQNLSAAGEQYLDFRPVDAAGPYLREGSGIAMQQVADTATAGDLTAKIDRLGELIDPVIVRRMGDLLVQVTSDEATLANLKAIVSLVGQTAHDKGRDAVGLFNEGQSLTMRLTGMGATQYISGIGAGATALGPAFGKVVVALGRLGDMQRQSRGFDALGPPLTDLMTTLSSFLPSVGDFADSLAPVTGQLRGIRVNAGAFTDMWIRAFPVGGPARVELAVK